MRPNFCWAFIGANTVGKTPTAILLSKEWKAKKKGVVIAFDPQYKFEEQKIVDFTIKTNGDIIELKSGLKCNSIAHDKNDKPYVKDWAEELITENSDKTFKWAHSLLILDDYRGLHPNDRTDPKFVELLALRVKINMDIIYICHNPMMILERLSYYTTNFSIFYTESDAGDFQKRVPKYVECQRAAILINKYVMKFGRGKYPNFPHIQVYTENTGLKLINIDRNKFKQII